MHDFTKKKWNAFGSAIFHPESFQFLWVVSCGGYTMFFDVSYRTVLTAIEDQFDSTWSNPSTWSVFVPLFLFALQRDSVGLAVRAGAQADELLNAFGVKSDHSELNSPWTSHEKPIRHDQNWSNPHAGKFNVVFEICGLVVSVVSVKDVFQLAAELFRMNMCERIYFTVDVSGTSNLLSRFVHPRRAWLSRG